MEESQQSSMNTSELNRHSFPPSGWIFLQPQTGWRAPTPTSSTFDQTVKLIRSHRLGNPAAVTKYKLATDITAIENELENFTRARLHMPAAPPPPPKNQPSSRVPGVVGAVAGVGSIKAGVDATIDSIRKLASGGALLMEWEESKLAPVVPEIADARGKVCANCALNKKGVSLSEWFTVPTSALIRKRLERLNSMKLRTSVDGQLNVCEACLCPLHLKVWTPDKLILSRMTPEVEGRLDSNCWMRKLKA